MDALIEEHLKARRYQEAFEVLVQSFENKVFRLACSILRDEALAEDACQDAFLRIWRALPQFEGRSSVSTWVYTVTRNLCLTRAKRATAERPLASWIPTLPRPAGSGPDIELALQQLPDKYRQILTLFYYEDKSHEAVSRMLDMPLGTVKTHLHRARKQLRQAIQEQTARRTA